jgi:4-deoxy-L-threo-5-hexosulose-uronate ketol-isomerase
LNYPNLRAEYFLERREIGIINVAGDGTIIADGQTYDLKKLDCLYIGKGTKSVHFASKNSAEPAVFYMLSCPAHKTSNNLVNPCRCGKGYFGFGIYSKSP